MALLLLAVPVFLANAAMPHFADDFCRAVGAGPLEALIRTGSEYAQWTGRAAVTFATFLLLGDARTPSPHFDLLNTLAFLSLVALVSFGVRRLLPGRPTEPDGSAMAGFNETLFLALALWWLPWSIGETALWTTGSIGYLWAVVAELLVLIGVHRPPGRRLHWLLPPFALVAGSLFEPLSAAVSLYLAGFCLHCRRADRPMPLAVLLAHGLGLVTTVAAPGNFTRAATLPPSDPWERLPAVLDLGGRLFGGGWAVPLALLVLPLLLARAGLAPATALLRRPAVWILPLAALTYLLLHLALPAPTLVPRLGFPASVALAAFLLLLFLHRPRTHGSEKLFAGVAVLAVLGTGLHAGGPLLALSAIGREWHEGALAQAGTEAVLPERLLEGSRIRARGSTLFVGLEQDPARGYNACFAQAYGLRSVRVVP